MMKNTLVKVGSFLTMLTIVFSMSNIELAKAKKAKEDNELKFNSGRDTLRENSGGTFAQSDANDIGEIFIKVIKYAMYVIAFVAVLAFIYAGFMFIFSQGENGGEKARGILTYAIIGLIVALLGWIILNTVARMLNV